MRVLRIKSLVALLHHRLATLNHSIHTYILFCASHTAFSFALHQNARADPKLVTCVSTFNGLSSRSTIRSSIHDYTSINLSTWCHLAVLLAYQYCRRLSAKQFIKLIIYAFKLCARSNISVRRSTLHAVLSLSCSPSGFWLTITFNGPRSLASLDQSADAGLKFLMA